MYVCYDSSILTFRFLTYGHFLAIINQHTIKIKVFSYSFHPMYVILNKYTMVWKNKFFLVRRNTAEIYHNKLKDIFVHS